MKGEKIKELKRKCSCGTSRAKHVTFGGILIPRGLYLL
jgi:hypothetical protein